MAKTRTNADKIRYRLARGQSHAEIAEKLGVTMSYVNWVRWYDQNRANYQNTRNTARNARYATDEGYRKKVLSAVHRRRGKDVAA